MQIIAFRLNLKIQCQTLDQNISTCIYLYFLNKALEYIGIDNYKAIYKYIQSQGNGNVHSD